MFAAIGTGCANITCCQPDALSPVNVALASSVPVLVHRLPTCVPVLLDALVEAQAGDEAGDIAAELHAELDGAPIAAVDDSPGAVVSWFHRLGQGQLLRYRP